MGTPHESWGARVALELAKVAEGLLVEGSTSIHADVAAEILAKASTYAADAGREIRLMTPSKDDDPPF